MPERQPEGFYGWLRCKMVRNSLWRAVAPGNPTATTTISRVHPAALGGKWLTLHLRISCTGLISSKQGWPKPARPAMGQGSEKPARPRSSRSSPRRGRPITWRRRAVYARIPSRKGARGITRSPERVLEQVQQHALDAHYGYERLYRNLFNPAFYWLAYQNVYANRGAMTPGSDGQTLDAMGDARLAALIALTRSRRYQSQPARREYIPKKNGGQRPLGIPSASDKLVQEVVRLLFTSTMSRRFRHAPTAFARNGAAIPRCSKFKRPSPVPNGSFSAGLQYAERILARPVRKSR